MLLQTSDVREKELADDVSVRNLILSVHEVLKTCPYLFYFFTYLQTSNGKKMEAASNGKVRNEHCLNILSYYGLASSLNPLDVLTIIQAFGVKADVDQPNREVRLHFFSYS